MTSRPAAPESETPETDAFAATSSYSNPLRPSEILAFAKRLERRLHLAQTEIKGHMRIEDDLKAENAKWLAKAMLYAPAMEQAQVRIAELEKDAARYRWLRIADSEWSRLFADPIKWEGGAWVKLGSRWVREHLDAAIDAALKDRA